MGRGTTVARVLARCRDGWGRRTSSSVPCHGSGYTKDGIHFEGPTPPPLEQVKIVLGDDGQLIVDKAFRYRYELGQWNNPQAYVKYVGVTSMDASTLASARKP